MTHRRLLEHLLLQLALPLLQQVLHPMLPPLLLLPTLLGWHLLLHFQLLLQAGHLLLQLRDALLFLQAWERVVGAGRGGQGGMCGAALQGS